MQTDLEQLISNSLDMAEGLLKELEGEFYPFGGYIDNKGAYKNVGLYEGDDFPLSETIIDQLKKYFEREIESGIIRAYAIAFDCLAKKDETSEKTDTIVIQYYSIINGQRATYYYPYKVNNNNAVDIVLS